MNSNVEPAEPLFLSGEFDINVDDKGRFSMPAETRRAIDTNVYGENLVVIVGTNGKPWLYPDKYYRTLLTKRTPTAVPAEALLRFDHFNVSMTFTVPVDKQGRVILPDKIVKRTGVKGEVTLAGAVDHAELWPRDAWEAYYEELKKNPNNLSNGSAADKDVHEGDR